MKLLIDTDAFCKLGITGLLADAVGVFGLTLSIAPVWLLCHTCYRRAISYAVTAPISAASWLPRRTECPFVPSPSPCMFNRSH